MSEKDDWPTAEEMRRPNPEIVRRLLETYAKVAREDLPPSQRPEFRIPPGDRLRRIFGSEA